MILADRRKLARLMRQRRVSQRTLALAAGWSAHSYLGRLLRGEVHTLDDRAAARIAHFLGVEAGQIFVPSVSTNTRRAVNKKGQAA